MKVSSPPGPGGNFRSDDCTHGGPAASFTQPASIRQPPTSSGVPQQRATSHVTCRKKAEEDTQARTMERTHSYRKRHQRTGVHIPHASSLLRAQIRATLHFSPPLLRRRGKNQKNTSPTCSVGTEKTNIQHKTETFSPRKHVLARYTPASVLERVRAANTFSNPPLSLEPSN